MSVSVPHKLPQHIAIIMDGNGRWAIEKGLSRIEGHRAGADTVRMVLELTGELGIPYLTLYAFSAENWRRPPEEVGALMLLLEEYLARQTAELNEKNVRLHAIGRIGDLPASCQASLRRSIAETAGNTGTNLVLALSYGGREEIVDAVKGVVRDVKTGKLDPDELLPEVFSQYLYTAPFPDPDLMIRTSGELRISNFLLWQLSYAELVVVKKYWPDFAPEDFLAALGEYAARERRFGGL
jgi:undecaprenyl diphosphate synthase